MKKSTLILLLVAVGLGAFVYFYEIRGGEERRAAETEAKKVFSFEPDDITEISLSRDGETLRFEKRDDAWVITEPISAKADQSSLDAIARNLTTSDVERRLTAAEDRLDTYGLRDPKIALTVKLKSGQQHRLRLGDEDFSGTKVYALIDEGQDLALLPKYLFSGADKSLFELRDKSILDVSQSEVNTLELNTPTGQFLAVKKGDDWQLEQPRPLPADDSEVRSILSKLSVAQMTEVVAEEAEDVKQYGLDHPAITARLRTETGDERVLMLGANVDEAYYARTNNRPLVFKVDADVYEKLNPSLFTLRNKQPAPFTRGDITRVRIKNEHQTIVCEKNDEDKWIVKEPAENKDREARSFKLFNPLEFKEATEIIDAPSNTLTARLDNPAIEVELTKKDGQKITLRISKKEGDIVYARHSLSPAVMTFEGGLFDELNFKVEEIL